MLQQISPQMVLSRFEQFAQAGEQLVDTNLPASELDTFAQLALKARSQKVATVSFVPPAIITADPDIDKIRSMISTAIAKSEKDSSDGTKAGKGTAKGFSARRGGATTGGSLGSLHSGYAANETQDLSRVC
jgi:polyisoprenyl-teichoic acid--peptidoglycan teichoic acid transferase